MVLHNTNHEAALQDGPMLVIDDLFLSTAEWQRVFTMWSQTIWHWNVNPHVSFHWRKPIAKSAS